MDFSFASRFSLNISPQQFRALLQKPSHEQLCKLIIDILNTITTKPVRQIAPADRQPLDDLVLLLLSTLANPAFRVPDRYALQMILENPRIASLTALSSFQTTDRFLQAVIAQPHNLVRLLTLYSARNFIHIDPATLFKAHPTLASLWYVQYAYAFHSNLPSADIHQRLRAHFQFPATAFVPTVNMPEAYFGSTYIDPGIDQMIKPHINRAIQAHAEKIPGNLPRNPRKIALLSTMWRENHSVYRIYADLLKSLRPHYHLTFFQIGRYAQSQTDLFDDVQTLEVKNAFPIIDPLRNNDFQVLLYPDVGMANESILLANHRLAPIQIALLGHSVSTWGAQIDYFISGREAELPERPERNYSERLVLLPGMGCSHNRPTFSAPKPIAPPPITSPADKIIICLPCNAHKINPRFLATLAQLRKNATRPILLRLFLGVADDLVSDLIPLQQTLSAALGPAFELFANQPYEAYLTALGQAHLCLDAYHFGGCNTVSDSLFMRTPMLCWQGDKWYNRIGPAMLRRCNFPELIATTESEYLATAHRLIHDDSFRENLRCRLCASDLDAAIYSADDAPHFRHAIDHLIANHAAYQSSRDRSPIVIPPLSARPA